MLEKTNIKLLKMKLRTFFGVIFFQILLLFVTTPKPGLAPVYYGAFIFMDLLLLVFVFVGNKKLELPSENLREGK